LAQATPKDDVQAPVAGHIITGLREGVLFLLIAVAVYLFVSLVGFEQSDPGWSATDGGTSHIQNVGGITGAWLADVMLMLFGFLSYLFPLGIVFAGVWFYRRRAPLELFDFKSLNVRIAGFVLTLFAGCGLAALHFTTPVDLLPQREVKDIAGAVGGILGQVIGLNLLKGFGSLGATLFLLTAFFAGITLLTGFSWIRLMDWVGQVAWRVLVNVARTPEKASHEAERADPVLFDDVLVEAKSSKPKRRRRDPEADDVTLDMFDATEAASIKDKPVIRPPAKASNAFKHLPKPVAGLPSLDILDPPRERKIGFNKAALETLSRQVETVLKSFGIDVKVVGVQPGPVVTRFELDLAPGVKASQITTLSKDLARSLSVFSVRVVEIIPGKSFVGLEIPNEEREVVSLSEILRAEVYARADSPLTLALGKDIAGKPTCVDLAKMPHLLIAGTTGSGKSVGVNAMILSLLFKTTPSDVRMIMIDPKMLELSVYEGIPHLLAPVVTDMKEAANALRWCVGEMERRYQLMAALGVRNIAGFNKKVKDAADAGTPIKDPLAKPEQGDINEWQAPDLHPLPYIVVLIDELADMMMVVGKKVEELIARLAQKARASGVHLILATQRPSVDVITGLIKANIPTRISFQVSSRIDSRTILDQMGAEHLLGHGDMLYLAPGTGIPTRVHGAFVADHEVHKVVEVWKSLGKPEYIEDIVRGGSESLVIPGMGDDVAGEGDPLFDEAVRFVTETRRASISSVQRRLKIGYNRAARMIEEMETAGIVGPMQSNGVREVIAPPPPER
jgi:DNA segregation ATPase FtsK/SpoIIIE, S-DNA-T family